MEAFVRTELLLGRDAIERLQQARVAVFGLGGVGGYVVEALARSGVGALDLIDHDTVSVSNLNRQIFALHSTIGRDKADVAKERVLDINPDIQVTLWKTFYLPDTADQFDLTQYDYIVDAIDTVTGKLELITRAKAAGTPILCAMGTGRGLESLRALLADQSAGLFGASILLGAAITDPVPRMPRPLVAARIQLSSAVRVWRLPHIKGLELDGFPRRYPAAYSRLVKDVDAMPRATAHVG